MNNIERLLADVPRPDGFLAARLVDVATGQVLAAVGDPGDPYGPAGSPADLPDVLAATVRSLTGSTTAGGGEGALEDLVVTTARRHHLVRLLPGLGGADALLLVTLDRATSNLALALHLLRHLEATLVA